MAHFAKINNNNIVTEVIVSEKDFINLGKVGDEFLWIQTSYNGNFRKQFAKVGGTYDKTKDKFISPKPFTSWTLDSNDNWQPPIVKPSTSDGTYHDWNESTQTWDLSE
mgnify:FL=1